MESKARLLDVSMNYQTRKPQIVFECEDDIRKELDALAGKELRVSAVRWREKRSKDANSYFHRLCGLIADALNASSTEIKNQLIAEYGQPEIVSTYKNGEEIEKINQIMMLDSINYLAVEWAHLKPTLAVQEMGDGCTYRVYHIMRGSHTYDSKEMSRLIDGAILAAQEAGVPQSEIDTLGDRERMLALMEDTAA